MLFYTLFNLCFKNKVFIKVFANFEYYYLPYMDKYTQIIVNSLDYNQIMVKLLTPNPSDKAFTDQVVYNTVVLIALVTGQPIADLIQLNWGAIFEYNNRGKVKCRCEFNLLRGFNFPINRKIENQLIYNYTVLNQPNFNFQIKDSLKVLQIGCCQLILRLD